MTSTRASPNECATLLSQRGMSYRSLAARTYHGKSYLHDLASGRKTPTPDAARRIDAALGAGGELAALATVDTRDAHTDDLGAVELGRRVAAHDLGAETLDRLEAAVDDLAVDYASRPAEALLPRIRHHLAYVARLLDGRPTLVQHRRLLIAGGWLTLLAATCHIDLQTRHAAAGHLDTARQLADQAEHPELAAWVLETRAWDALTEQDFRHAVALAQQAQAIAPRGSSALIQATAQEGRAWARMGQARETHNALDRTARLVSPLAVPDRPEHHYRYDPGKALAYTATTLSWLGDPSAEDYARDVVNHLGEPPVGRPRPRRAAIARLDLALALLVAGKPDEAAASAITAITAGRLVASNWWRAKEVLVGVERSGIREAVDLRDAYEAYQPASGK